jgi:hypothetical protein
MCLEEHLGPDFLKKNVTGTIVEDAVEFMTVDTMTHLLSTIGELFNQEAKETLESHRDLCRSLLSSVSTKERAALALKLDSKQFLILLRNEKTVNAIRELLSGESILLLTRTLQLENIVKIPMLKQERHMFICRAIRLRDTKFLKDHITESDVQMLGGRSRARYYGMLNNQGLPP